MSVFSNKQDKFTQEIAKKYFSKWNFTKVAGDVTGRPLKPDPAVPLEMAKSMKTSPSKVAFIGDSETDIKTGIAAGMTPIAVTWGFRSRERLESAGAAVFADNIAELARILGVPLTGGFYV
jgi:phosphoglycolate phosphatase